MGGVAAELADLVIVTDEDPRLEDPRAINEAIADGARAAGARDGETLWVIDDRREAIGHAIGMAREGDVVLLAGKGHERSIVHGSEPATLGRGGRRSRSPGRSRMERPMTSPELHAWRVTDPATWNAFVEGAPYHAFPQLWEWGEVRAMGGWRPVRLAIGPDRDRPLAGAQLLLRRMPVARLAPCLRAARADRRPRRPCRACRSAGGAAFARRCGEDRHRPRRPGGTSRDAVRPRAAGGAVARSTKGPAANDARDRPGRRRGSAARQPQAQASAVRQQGGARRGDDRALRRQDSRGGDRSGAGGIQSHLSVHRRASRLRRAAAVLLRAGLVPLRADGPRAPQLRGARRRPGRHDLPLHLRRPGRRGLRRHDRCRRRGARQLPPEMDGHQRLRARGLRRLRHVGAGHRRHPPVQGGIRRRGDRVRRRARPLPACADGPGPAGGDSRLRPGAARPPQAARPRRRPEATDVG